MNDKNVQLTSVFLGWVLGVLGTMLPVLLQHYLKTRTDREEKSLVVHREILERLGELVNSTAHATSYEEIRQFASANLHLLSPAAQATWRACMDSPDDAEKNKHLFEALAFDYHVASLEYSRRYVQPFLRSYEVPRSKKLIFWIARRIGRRKAQAP